MKTRTIIALCIAFGCILLGAAAIAGAVFTVGFDLSRLSRVEFEEKTTEIDCHLMTLTVDALDCNVELIYTNGGDFKVVSPDAEGIYTHVEWGQTTLHIERRVELKWYESFGFWWRDEPLTVKVYLPTATYNDLYLHTVSGNIRIGEGLAFHIAQITSTSGNVRISEAEIVDLQVKTVSGDISISGSAGSLTASSTSGDITLDQLAVVNSGDTSLKTVSGDIVWTGGSASSLTAQTTSGELSCEALLLSGALWVKTTSGDVTFSRSDAAEAEIKTSSGDVKCRFLTEKQLLPSTSSGEISALGSTAGSPPCRVETVSGDITFSVGKSAG